MHEERIETIHLEEISQETLYVLYIMDSSQRVSNNHALIHALELANKLNKKLIVAHFFNPLKTNALIDRFYIDGLKDVSEKLSELEIKFIVSDSKFGTFTETTLSRTEAVVLDRAYLKEDLERRKRFIKNWKRTLYVVETSLVVPPEEVSRKREYAARTIRPKIMKKYKEFLTLLKMKKIKETSINANVSTNFNLNVSGDKILRDIGYSNKELNKKSELVGGYSEASKKVSHFIRYSLDSYDDERQDVLSENGQSFLSPYLRFGHISPTEIILKVEKARGANHKGRKAFVEEILVRRELAFNFVINESSYDDFNCLPNWCQKTLAMHDEDNRDPKYSKNDFDLANTDDDLWNYCMNKMKLTGYLHNALRMYWGKKILEWGSSSSYSYNILIELNNKYFIDGRDPNSYTNALWCFGLHDRAWGERKIYGKVRSHSKDSAMRKVRGSDGLNKLQEKLK
jgi:deoxyribodipyrimidine photo-lyase